MRIDTYDALSLAGLALLTLAAWVWGGWPLVAGLWGVLLLLAGVMGASRVRKV